MLTATFTDPADWRGGYELVAHERACVATSSHADHTQSWGSRGNVTARAGSVPGPRRPAFSRVLGLKKKAGLAEKLKDATAVPEARLVKIS